MDQDRDTPPLPSGRWDPLIHRLHALRREAGEPSYAVLARRIEESGLAATNGASNASVCQSRNEGYARLPMRRG